MAGFSKIVKKLYILRMLSMLRQTHLNMMKANWGSYVPYKSLGNIGGGRQHSHLWGRTHTEVTACDYMPNLLTTGPARTLHLDMKPNLSNLVYTAKG